MEQELAGALAAGDRRAVLTGLMRAYGDEILRFCSCMLRDQAAAEDVRQAVFIAAYEGLGEYTGHGSLRGWLFGIARHRCLDAARSRQRWNWRFWANSQSAVADGGEGDPPAMDSGDSVDHQRRLAVLRDCLRELPAALRVVVLLRYQEELPYEEIGRMSRERPATVQARVARALPVLRACTERKGGAP